MLITSEPVTSRGTHDPLAEDARTAADAGSRVAAAVALLHRARLLEREALTIRDEGLRELVAEHGRAATARITGVDPETVKAVTRGIRRA